MDTVPAQPVNTPEGLTRARERARAAASLDSALLDELWHAAGAEQVELSAAEFGDALLAVGAKCNFGADEGEAATAAKREAFWRALHLADLALAQACALGRDGAWQQFVTKFRWPLTRAAVGLTKSAALGEELATAIYSELFGVTERAGVRWSPLTTYSGRGSLMGWLRAMLAQRHVNHFRKTHRETALDDVEIAAAPPENVEPNQDTLHSLESALQSALDGLIAEDRLLLSAYYLDRHTLVEIGRVLKVHEATVSRKLRRVTEQVRKQLLKVLQARGFSRRAADEALGIDPRDMDINLRRLLQTPETDAFSHTEDQS